MTSTEPEPLVHRAIGERTQGRRLAMGADHRGLRMRRVLAEWARGLGFEVRESGATDERPYDYPDAADEVARDLLAGVAFAGVLLCGSGIGICIRANRYPGVRAAQACNVDMARAARAHNDANVVCLASDWLADEDAIRIVETFLATAADGADRHVRRVCKLDAPV